MMSKYTYAGSVAYREELIRSDIIAAAELGALSLAGTVLAPRYLQSLGFTLRELRSIL